MNVGTQYVYVFYRFVQVLEFGAPHELIENDGHFASMVADTGEGMATQLRQKAMQRKIDQSHG